jgi:outer membrane protein TolC
MFLLWISLWISDVSARDLTFEDCARIVSQKNPEIRSARENLTAAEENLGGALAPFFPELSAGLSTSRQSPTSIYGDPLHGLNAQLRMNLFAGLRDEASIRQARARRSVAEATLDQTRARVSFQLRRAYAQYRYARENRELAEKIRERRSQNERLVRALYENGRENKGSYLLSKALFDQAVFETRVARDQAVIASQQLAHILGEDSFDIEPVGEVPLQNPPDGLKAEEFLNETPLHRIRKAQQDLAEAVARGAWSGFLPSLDLTGSTSNRGESPVPSENRQWSLGLSLTIPIFSGLSTFRDVRARAAQERAASADLQTTDFDILNELRQNLFSFQQSVEKWKVDLTTLEAATIRATISRKRYNNGILMFEQWDIIETDLINRQKTALISKRDRIIAESAWMQSRGKGDLP